MTIQLSDDVETRRCQLALLKEYGYDTSAWECGEPVRTARQNNDGAHRLGEGGCGGEDGGKPRSTCLQGAASRVKGEGGSARDHASTKS